MPLDLSMILAIWGAALSTVLGVAQIHKLLRDRPKISVDAGFVFRTCNADDEVKGTKIDLGKRGWNEILLAVQIVNSGEKSTQISAILIEEASGATAHVRTDKLPVVLEPRTSIDVQIQKEWIDKAEIVFVGAIDAVGKRYPITKKNLLDLIEQTSQLPSNRKQYRQKTDPSVVVDAFQVKDKATLIKRSGA